ncbi:unnamed protein product [Tuber aestivum]|uniref:Uncharacterized protein n=1 Tax=Tuber aestivum TaxID=59557 RepID=A0A292Q1X1_9PEZI|nr:unnamed protein product [Tuber aestivum]
MEIGFPIPTQNIYPRLRLDQMESPPSSPSSSASSSTAKASSPPRSPPEDEIDTDSDDSLDTPESDNIEDILCSQNPARRYRVPGKRPRKARSPTSPRKEAGPEGGDEPLSMQAPPKKKRRGGKMNGEGGSGRGVEAEAASRKPSDWEGEKWWRMTYSEDDEFDKKEQELEELERREKVRREKVWAEKREREREREMGEEKGRKEKPDNKCEKEKRKGKEEGEEKVEPGGADVELEGGVIIELEGEEIIELEEENGRNVGGIENPDGFDSSKKLNTPGDANSEDAPASPNHSLHRCTAR